MKLAACITAMLGSFALCLKAVTIDMIGGIIIILVAPIAVSAYLQVEQEIKRLRHERRANK